MTFIVSHKHLKIFLGYAILYLALFFLLPWKGELPGNTDTLLGISMSNIFREEIGLFFSGAPGFTVFYPVRDFLVYGENCYGLALIFLFFKLLTANDIWAYYLFLCAILTLNSIAVFKLTTLYVKNELIAALAGMVVSLAGFTLANIDDLNIVFVFFPALAFYFLQLGLQEGRKDLFYIGILLSGLQIWFGFYVFVFQFLALLLFCAISLKRLRMMLDLGDIAMLIGAYVIPAAPLLVRYWYNHLGTDIVAPYDNAAIRTNTSLSWYDFANVLPHNLLYSSEHNIYKNPYGGWFAKIRKHCFPGFVLPLLALLGIYKSVRSRKAPAALLALFLVFFTLSFGVNLPYFDLLIRLPLGNYFRLPLRLYLFALIFLAVYFGIGLEALAAKVASRFKRIANTLVVFVGAIFILENVPFPLHGYEYASLILPSPLYKKFFEKVPTRRVVLDLPSTYQCLSPDKERLWTYNREALYMNWQTYHGQIIVGGVNSYIPGIRTEMDPYIQRLPDKEALSKIKSLGVDYIVFHKNLVLLPAENILAKLRRSPDLSLVEEGDDLAIFALGSKGGGR